MVTKISHGHFVFGRRADRTCFFSALTTEFPQRVCLKDKAWMRETRALERRLKPYHRQLMNLP